AWTAVSNAAWIAITAGDTGAGNGTVALKVSANTGAARTGTATIAGQTLTVNQAGAACSFSIAPTSETVPAAGDSKTVTVTVVTGGACAWTAVSNVDWVTIASGASGTGHGTVTYSV